MKKILLILLCFPLFFSCFDDNKKDAVKEEDSLSQHMVIGFSITSKNSELTSETGTDVSINEMITKNVNSGDKILFNDFQITLNNEVEGALNFYSDKGRLMCNAPTELSVMSMPPDGRGLTTYRKGDNIEFSKMSLIKVGSINFVVSDIKFNQQ